MKIDKIFFLISLVILLVGCTPSFTFIDVNSGSPKFHYINEDVEITIKGWANPYVASFDILIKNKRTNDIYVDYDNDFALRILKTNLYPEYNIGREVSPLKQIPLADRGEESRRKKLVLQSSIVNPNDKISGSVNFDFPASENHKMNYYWQQGDVFLLTIDGLQDIVTDEKIYLEVKFRLE